MTPQLMRVLSKLYRFENRVYDADLGVGVFNPKALLDKEQAVLQDSGWPVNEIARFAGHDDVVAKLLSLKGHAALSRKRCLNAFVAGVGGSWLRGRSVLPAWLLLETLPQHAYRQEQRFLCCRVCADGIKASVHNVSYLQYCFYAGNSYASTPLYAYLNLKHLTEVEPVVPTAEDVTIFRKLLELLRHSDTLETPGQFEKRLTAAKIMAGDKYSRRGVLDALARAGVIPNRFIKLKADVWADFYDIAICEDELRNTKGRSDMEMPWAGWLGELKVDEVKLQELFGDYI